MRERERDAAAVDDEMRSGGGIEGGEDTGPCRAGCGLDEAHGELLADHRSGSQDLDGAGRDVRQPSFEQSSNGGRQRPVVVESAGIGGDQAGEFTDEERIPTGPAMDLGDELRRDVGADDLCHQRFDRRTLQAAEMQRRNRPRHLDERTGDVTGQYL
ncbi:MAG TPA: hypothetical protein VM264_08600, partial [Acidimicrobiales bacterium]|nr:hypothetical protein [Acidimicrobiales bacterium]